MPIGTFAVLYNHGTNHVLNMWARASSDNIATWKADNKITIDGVDVANGFNDADVADDIRVVLVTDPTDADVTAPAGVFLATMSGDTMTDINERTDSGRNGDNGGTGDSEYDFADPPV